MKPGKGDKMKTVTIQLTPQQIETLEKFRSILQEAHVTGKPGLLIGQINLVPMFEKSPKFELDGAMEVGWISFPFSTAIHDTIQKMNERNATPSPIKGDTEILVIS